MANEPARSRPAIRVLRAALLSGAALAFLVASLAPADAYRPKAASTAKKPNPEKDGFGEAAKNSVLQIVVSIGSQRVTLFSDGVPIAQGTVSTGTPGHLTPMGVFSVIQKDRYHHSNLYGNAPMYYMQRITWSGVAMHQGFVTGHPASHGCIRLTHSFAAALWPTTRLGVRVIVARNDLAPVAFEHPLLFTPRPKPADPMVEIAKPRPGEEPVKVAESTGRANDASGVDVSQGNGESAKPAGNAVDPPKGPVTTPKAVPQPPKNSGQVAVFVSRKEGKVSVRQGFVPLFDMPVQIDEPDHPLGTHVFTAMGTKPDGSGMRWNVITIPTQSNATVEKRRVRGKKEASPPTVVAATPPSTAAQALDRIHLPQEAADRISEILVPGSSLLVSDQGASGETGRGTDFIVLTR